MPQSLETGLSFGLTSGIITTLGIIVGLESGSHSKAVVVAGILVAAVADSFSDALGIHIAEESDDKRTRKEVWESTFSTLFSKLFVVFTFVIPVYFFPLPSAVLIDVVWGAFLLGIFSFYLAYHQQEKAWKVILEHFIVAGLVILATYFLGQFTSQFQYSK
ncbi:MAG: hypothetical protein GF370_03245 [Candidatus Nealsonbacteria bacterium]|nr:hypothetical protein [Candidatus Nealsonbacteria bacterium]